MYQSLRWAAVVAVVSVLLASSSPAVRAGAADPDAELLAVGEAIAKLCRGEHEVLQRYYDPALAEWHPYYVRRRDYFDLARDWEQTCRYPLLNRGGIEARTAQLEGVQLDFMKAREALIEARQVFVSKLRTDLKAVAAGIKGSGQGMCDRATELRRAQAKALREFCGALVRLRGKCPPSTEEEQLKANLCALLRAAGRCFEADEYTPRTADLPDYMTRQLEVIGIRTDYTYLSGERLDVWQQVLAVFLSTTVGRSMLNGAGGRPVVQSEGLPQPSRPSPAGAAVLLLGAPAAAHRSPLGGKGPQDVAGVALSMAEVASDGAALVGEAGTALTVIDVAQKIDEGDVGGAVQTVVGSQKDKLIEAFLKKVRGERALQRSYAAHYAGQLGLRLGGAALERTGSHLRDAAAREAFAQARREVLSTVGQRGGREVGEHVMARLAVSMVGKAVLRVINPAFLVMDVVELGAYAVIAKYESDVARDREGVISAARSDLARLQGQLRETEARLEDERQWGERLAAVTCSLKRLVREAAARFQACCVADDQAFEAGGLPPEAGRRVDEELRRLEAARAEQARQPATGGDAGGGA